MYEKQRFKTEDCSGDPYEQEYFEKDLNECFYLEEFGEYGMITECSSKKYTWKNYREDEECVEDGSSFTYYP